MPGPGQVAAAAAVLAAFAALATAAWAQGFPRGHGDALGPNFEAAPQLRDGVRHRPSRRATESLERLLRWNQIAIDASGLDHTPVRRARRACSASSSARAARAARWRSSTSRCSTRSTRSSAATRATPASPRAPRRRLAGRRDRAGGARHAGRHCSRRRRASFDAALAEDLARDPRTARAQGERHRARPARRRRDPRAARQRRLAARRAARRHRLHHQATRRASGGRTRSARSRSRWARTGAR